MGFINVEYKQNRWKPWRKGVDILYYVQDVNRPNVQVVRAITHCIRYGDRALTRLYLQRAIWWLVFAASVVSMWTMYAFRWLQLPTSRQTIGELLQAMAFILLLFAPLWVLMWTAQQVDTYGTLRSRIRLVKHARHFVWPTGREGEQLDLRIDILEGALQTACQTHTTMSTEVLMAWLRDPQGYRRDIFGLIDAYLESTRHFLRSVEGNDPSSIFYQTAIKQIEHAADDAAQMICEYIDAISVVKATEVDTEDALRAAKLAARDDRVAAERAMHDKTQGVLAKLTEVEDVDSDEIAERNDRWNHTQVTP